LFDKYDYLAMDLCVIKGLEQKICKIKL